MAAQLEHDPGRCCEVLARQDPIQLMQRPGEPCPVCPETVGLDPIPPFLPGLGRLLYRTLHLRQRQRNKRKPISSLFGVEVGPFETLECKARRGQVSLPYSFGRLGANDS
jgi:hypothetical protein